MSKKSSYLLGILLTIVIGAFLYWKFCCSACHKQNKHIEENTKNKVVAVPDEKKAALNSFSVNDANGNLAFTIDDNFRFNKSNFAILDSVSSGVNDGVLKIKDYLNANSQKTVDITGYYTNEETNNSAFPNLGLARANSVKNYFVSKDVPAKAINTFGKLNDEIVADENGIFNGPLAFNIVTHNSSDDSAADNALKSACAALKENPIVLYFKPAHSSITLTSEQRKKLAIISQCVDKLGSKIQVIGHTDDTASKESNMRLGKKRAEFVKNYLVKNGILSENIETSSKGESSPIADNSTQEGRAKNRRTVITIN
ncbi:OmpA family protein [Tenacibaculum sp. UWU-22]|uniref:OmpA family protein n=1 Tax=Tenacibaculum sp. UWU-22 TaxID=3234187 RepID=UPI0034DB0611